MNTLSFKTSSCKKKLISKKWIVINADNQILGRISTKIVYLLMGKHKTYYSPNMDCGDHVIIINSNKIRLTGNKWMNKKYIRYTGYPGGKKEISAINLFKKNPNILIYKSVKRMLPKNRLSRSIIKNLHIYSNSKHKHYAQNPITITK